MLIATEALVHGCRPARVADAFPDSVLRKFGKDAKDSSMSASSSSDLSAGLEFLALAESQRLLAPNPRFPSFPRAALLDVPVFNISNVVEYVAPLMASFRAEENLSQHLGRLAPPYPSFFVEWSAPLPSYEQAGMLGPGGVLFQSTTIDALSSRELRELELEEFTADAKWVLQWQIVRSRTGGKGLVGPVAAGTELIDKDGRGIGRVTDNIAATSTSLSDDFAPGFHAGLRRHATLSLFPSLFALSLMNCKNVKIVTEERKRNIARKHRRDDRGPSTERYHVLNIAPMTRVLDSQGDAQSKGLEHALQFCRGHFKSFTEEAPLFGKNVGSYYWEPQARGSIMKGVVVKDYDVTAGAGSADRVRAQSDSQRPAARRR